MYFPNSYRSMLVLVPFFVSATTAHTAPPKLDYLFPAGGQRGTSVEITAGGAFERWPVKAHIEGNGIDIKPAKTSGKLSLTIPTDAEPGVYWLRLYDEDGPSIARPFIVGVLPEILEQEPNDDPKKPQLITKSSILNGRLDKPGDVDTFACKLTKGQTLVASLEAHKTLRSPMDGVLQILTSDGFVLEQNDDYHGFDPQIAFTASKDGTYLVRVFAFPAVPDSTIRFAGKENFVYRLTITTEPFVEYAYPLAMARSAPSTVELVGWNIPDDLRKFPVTPREGPNLLKLFDPRIANVFHVRQEPNPVLAAPSKRENPLMVTPPITITGRIDKRGDIDVYQFDARKGDKLAIRIEARTLGFPLDPILRLTNNVGTMLAQSKAAAIGSDPLLDFTAVQDGSYRLEVRDLHGDGGMRHVYRIRIGAITPDFELKVVGDTFTLSPSKPLEIPITLTRLGGFKPEIVLSVEGLPKEIAATITAKTITLRATDKTTFAGPIRIVGSATDGTKRYARTPVVELARATETFWLTAAWK